MPEPFKPPIPFDEPDETKYLSNKKRNSKVPEPEEPEDDPLAEFYKNRPVKKVDKKL